MSLKLVIGSKRWSSWSLRPWIALRQAAIPFDEILVPLRQPETKAQILVYSPSGKIPVLLAGDDCVWDSLAILEYLAERFPDRSLWPNDSIARAHARAISAEMHSGFPDLRRELPMDAAAILPTPELSDETQANIARICAIWGAARSRFGSGGAFLFGKFSNADAMFAPVASRFQTYGISVEPVCQAYIETVMALPAMRSWCAHAAQENS